MDEEKVKKLIRELIIEIGEDPTREGLARTPERIVGVYSMLSQCNCKIRIISHKISY